MDQGGDKNTYDKITGRHKKALSVTMKVTQRLIYKKAIKNITRKRLVMTMITDIDHP